MAATTELPQEDHLPTEDSPEEGAVCYAGVSLTAAVWFVEDGYHVIRSTEFPVSASDADFQVAVSKLIDNLEDFADYVFHDKDEATDADGLLAIAIYKRLTEAFRASVEYHRNESFRLAIKHLLSGRRRRAASDPRGLFHPARPTSSPLQRV